MQESNEDKSIEQSTFLQLNPERPIITQRHISIEKLIERLDAIEIPEKIVECMKKFCQIPNTKRVLSLAGGGAQGIPGNAALIYFLDKIGVLQYFDEIWGASAGSIVGSGYASGLSPREILEITANLRSRKIIEFSIVSTIKNEALFKTTKIHKMFSEILPVKTFEECRVPFYALGVGYNGDNEWIKVFHSGSLPDAVVASMSVPDIFEPMEIDGKMYVDGGLLEDTPCISVYKNHQENNDKRNLQILGTDFCDLHYDPSTSGIFNKVLNLLNVSRHQIFLNQLERTRCQKNTKIAAISIHVGIAKTEFGKMGPQIIPAYYELVEKIEKLCIENTWNSNI